MTPVVAIVGPTATGKSELALRLAERFGVEIVSADSAQVYAGLDVGTAKPTPEEQARVPHHLVDVASPERQFTLGEYLRLARPLLDEIHARGRLPLVVGGTGLYVRALLEGFRPPPPAPPGLRADLEARETEALVAELERLDPVTASRIDRHNRRRLVRALEVCLATGRPFSEQTSTAETGLRPLRIGLAMGRARLVERIDRRVERMVHELGWLEEVRTLAEKGLGPSLRRLDVLGYPELLDVVEGKLSLEDAVGVIQQKTRRFARRQVTWFRREPDLRWIDLDHDALPEETAAAWIRPFLAAPTR